MRPYITDVTRPLFVISACGSVTSTVFTNTSTWKAEIRLVPDAELAPLMRLGWYRWIFYRTLGNSTAEKIIDHYENFTLDVNKYSEDNYVLRIKNLNLYDEGKYFVNCWGPEKQYNSGITKIVLPATTTSETWIGGMLFYS